MINTTTWGESKNVMQSEISYTQKNTYIVPGGEKTSGGGEG